MEFRGNDHLQASSLYRFKKMTFVRHNNLIKRSLTSLVSTSQQYDNLPFFTWRECALKIHLTPGLPRMKIDVNTMFKF